MMAMPFPICVAELPAVVTERIDDSDNDWVELTSFGRVMEPGEMLRHGNIVWQESSQRDDYKTVQLRHQAVLVVREAHDGELTGVDD